MGCEGGGRRGGRTPVCQTTKNFTVRRSKQEKSPESKIIGVRYVLCFSTSICKEVCFVVFQSHLLIAGSTHAVQHVLNAIGYESNKSAGGKPGDQGPVAMEMEPEDVQWLKVRVDLPCSLFRCHLFLPFLSPHLPVPFSFYFCIIFFSLDPSVLPLPPFSKLHATSLVPRLSPRANTASDRKLGGPWE